MKGLMCVFVFTLVLTDMYSQLLNVEWGQTYSGFNYTNSQGGSLSNLQPSNATYINANYHFQLPSDKANVIVGLSINNYGALGSDALLDNYFEWNVSYIGLKVGLKYYFARAREFQFFIRPTVSLEYLLNGTQTLNNQVFNLSGEDEFDNFITVPRLGIGVQYPISNKAAMYLSYAYGMSFSLVDASPEDNEKLNINMHNIGVGVIIQLPGCNCAFKNY